MTQQKKTVDVVLAQQKLSIRTDSNPEEVLEAAALVNRKLEEALPFGQPVSHQILLLVAMNLAHELLQKETANEDFKTDMRERSATLLARLEKDFTLS
jgi:cell division protein ZapA (FtsZ GTPase activity inhibitor)